MKKHICYILAFTLLVAACRRKNDNVSNVVVVPHLELKGQKFITINVGDPAPADEGATVVDDQPVDGNSNVMVTENTVDPSTPGIYYMLYQTKTKNGYTVGTARYVAVTNYPDDVNLSGTYMRTTNGVLVEVTRVSRALYKNADMGGAGLSDAIYFAVLNDSTIDAGPQYSESIGDVIDASKEGLKISDTETYFQYALDAPGYGTPLRKFVKQ